jgi:hypothetical protein
MQRALVVRDTMAVAKRCQDRYWEQAGATLAVTLDVKMVSVEDGRVRWSCRDTKRERGDEKVAGTRTYEVPPGESVIGGTVGGIGGSAAGVGLVLYVANTLDRTPTAGITELSLGLMVGGVGLAALGLILDNATREYPPPDDVLCQPGWRAIEDMPKIVQRSPTAGSSVTFTEERKLQGSDMETRRKQLLKNVIRDFTSAVANMKN